MIDPRRSCPAGKPLAETNVDLAFDLDIHDLTRVANLKDVPPGRPRRSLL